MGHYFLDVQYKHSENNIICFIRVFLIMVGPGSWFKKKLRLNPDPWKNVADPQPVFSTPVVQIAAAVVYTLLCKLSQSFTSKIPRYLSASQVWEPFCSWDNDGWDFPYWGGSDHLEKTDPDLTIKEKTDPNLTI